MFVKFSSIAFHGASIHDWMTDLWYPNRSGPARRDKCLACFASHYECWDRGVSKTSLACGSASTKAIQAGFLVLEDDALLCGELPPIEQLDQHTITLLGGAIHTMSAWSNKGTATEMDDVLAFVKTLRIGMNRLPRRLQWACSMAYYLPVAVANELREHVASMKKHGKHGVRSPDNFLEAWVNAAVFPPPFAQNREAASQTSTEYNDIPVGFYLPQRIAKRAAVTHSAPLPALSASEEEVTVWQARLPVEVSCGKVVVSDSNNGHPSSITIGTRAVISTMPLGKTPHPSKLKRKRSLPVAALNLSEPLCMLSILQEI